jgi:hypothetical protein
MISVFIFICSIVNCNKYIKDVIENERLSNLQNLERTWWMLFQKHVVWTKLDILLYSDSPVYFWWVGGARLCLFLCFCFVLLVFVLCRLCQILPVALDFYSWLQLRFSLTFIHTDCTWWMLFQKHVVWTKLDIVRTIFDIYVFMRYQWLLDYNVNSGLLFYNLYEAFFTYVIYNVSISVNKR